VEGEGGPVADVVALGNVGRRWESVGGSVKGEFRLYGRWGEALRYLGEALWKVGEPYGGGGGARQGGGGYGKVWESMCKVR
jgi:hypothetical protein